MPDEKPPADPNTEETERTAPQNSAESQFPPSSALFQFRRSPSIRVTFDLSWT